MKCIVLLFLLLQGCAFTECGIKGYHYGYTYGLFVYRNYVDAVGIGQAGAAYGDMYCLEMI